MDEIRLDVVWDVESPVRYHWNYNKRRIEKLFKDHYGYRMEIAYLNLRKIGGNIERRYKYNILDKDGNIVFKNQFLYELGEYLHKEGLYYEYLTPYVPIWENDRLVSVEVNK